MSKNRGRGRAISGHIVGLLGHLAHHLRAHVLELVIELDFFGNCHAVLGRARRAEALVEDDIAAFGTQRHLHGVGERIDATHHTVTRVGGKSYGLGGHVWLL